MAENSEEGEWQSYGNWFGGWMKTVKDTSVSAMEVVKTQTASAVELVKRDVTEFSQTMQCDASTTAARIRTNMSEGEQEAGGGLKAGLGSLLGGISKMLMVEPDSDEDEEVLISRSGPMFDRAKARLQSLQTDPDTYLTEPEDEVDFARWREDFCLDDHKGEVSDLLVVNEDIRALYTKTVPSDLSHAAFWERYFYRVHCLHREQMRRSQLIQRAHTIETSIHEDINMGDDWVDFDTPSSPKKASFLERQMRHAELHEPGVITMSHDVPALPREPRDESRDLKPRESRDQPRDTKTPSPSNTTSGHSKQVSEETPSQISDKNECENQKTPSNSDDEDSIVNISERSSPERVRENLSLGTSEAILADLDSDTVPTDQILTVSVEEALNQDSKADDVTTSGSDVIADVNLEVELKTREKGDLVLVGGRNGNTPTDSTGSNKDSVASLEGEEWDEFDEEVTEDDLKLAQEMAKSLHVESGKGDDEGWDDWE